MKCRMFGNTDDAGFGQGLIGASVVWIDAEKRFRLNHGRTLNPLAHGKKMMVGPGDDTERSLQNEDQMLALFVLHDDVASRGYVLRLERQAVHYLNHVAPAHTLKEGKFKQCLKNGIFHYN